jgi:hypothetical protein
MILQTQAISDTDLSSESGVATLISQIIDQTN